MLFCDALMECSNESYVKDIVCQQVRQEYCTAEWRMLEVNNQTDGLIDCEEYDETASLNCGDQFVLQVMNLFVCYCVKNFHSIVKLILHFILYSMLLHFS